MKRFLAVAGGLAMTLSTFSYGLADEASYPPRADQGARRSAYSYVRVATGEVTVVSAYNGRVSASRNMPVSTGDEISTSDAGRAEIALADGNLLELGGGTRARLDSLAAQQGEEDSVSTIRLIEGSAMLAAVGTNESGIPRIDTDEATVYLEPGAEIRVNADPRHGTSVIARAGRAEVRTPQGSYNVNAGEYLVARGEYEPEVARGSFSRDRFDIWAEDRLGSASESRSASARYVDSDYAGDVAAMDGYGDWNYNEEYGGDVWSPRVDAGWTPYSYGSWYYTPAGLTWWSADPWGWYPFHYGSWFFSGNRWCWGPASVYSPAWVYWGFTPGFVGWCPVGFYSYWSPWFDGYFRHQGWNRPGFSIAMQGTFSTRTVDFRGWNFTGSHNLGTAGTRMDVIGGTRIANRLGAAQLAISSHPIVVPARAGGAREAVQSFIREAPHSIERSTPAGSDGLAPILAHQRTLPEQTLAAVQQRAVVASRGSLAGPGVADIAPRGALVDRHRSLTELTSRGPAAQSDRLAAAPEASNARTPSGVAGNRPSSDWRARSVETRDRELSRTSRPDARTVEPARPERAAPSPSSDWRSRARGGTTADASPTIRSSETPREESWRSRQDLPPARRVIEGAVPGRRDYPSRNYPSSADGGARRSWRDSGPPPVREFRNDSESLPHGRVMREAPPQVREFRAEPRAPRDSHPGPAPAPRVERAPVQSAPRSEPHHSAPPNRGRPDR